MKAKIERTSLINCIDITPETEAELKELYKIWSDSKVQLRKGGCCLHGDRKTQHSIDNSDFAILIRKEEEE